MQSSFYGGKQGLSFSIVANYPTVQAMIDDFNGDTCSVEIGEFVLINSNPNDEDNGKLYKKDITGQPWYVADLSGPKGESFFIWGYYDTVEDIPEDADRTHTYGVGGTGGAVHLAVFDHVTNAWKDIGSLYDGADVGNVNDLLTDTKESLVAAINETYSKLYGKSAATGSRLHALDGLEAAPLKFSVRGNAEVVTNDYVGKRGEIKVVSYKKNMFSPDGGTVLKMQIAASTGDIDNNIDANTILVRCEGSKEYTLSKAVSNRFIVAESTTYPEHGGVVNVLYSINSAEKTTVTTSEDAKFLLFCISHETGPMLDVIQTVNIVEGAVESTDAFEGYVGTIQTSGLRNVREVYDEVTKVDGKWSTIRRIGAIESYAGETITTDYISSTGGLDTGSRVFYVLPTPVNEELDSATQKSMNGFKIIDHEFYIVSEDDQDPVMEVSYVFYTTGFFADIAKGGVLGGGGGGGAVVNIGVPLMERNWVYNSTTEYYENRIDVDGVAPNSRVTYGLANADDVINEYEKETYRLIEGYAYTNYMIFKSKIKPAHSITIVIKTDGVVAEEGINALAGVVEEIEKTNLSMFVAPGVTAFNSDGSIVKTYENGDVERTVFNADGSIETFKNKGGDTLISKVIFKSDGSIEESLRMEV